MDTIIPLADQVALTLTLTSLFHAHCCLSSGGQMIEMGGNEPGTLEQHRHLLLHGILAALNHQTPATTTTTTTTTSDIHNQTLSMFDDGQHGSANPPSTSSLAMAAETSPIGILINVIAQFDALLPESDSSANPMSPTTGSTLAPISNPTARELVFYPVCLDLLDKFPKEWILIRFDLSLLQHLGLIGDVKTCNRQIIRFNTKVLYTQTKLNLCREESQGYAKLVVEFSAGLPPSFETFCTSTLQETSTILVPDLYGAWLDHIERQVTPSIEHVQALIGTFHLDPTRVLDIILDTFSANIRDHTNFFLLFLRRAVDAISSPSTINHLIGFKLAYHIQNQQTAGENGEHHDITCNAIAEKMFWMTSVLIKEGLLSLETVLHHLSPVIPNCMKHDEGIYLINMDLAKSNASRYSSVGSLGSVSLDGQAISSGTTVSGADQQEVKDSLSDQELVIWNNPAAGLAYSLLCVGSLTKARTILDRYPKLSIIYPEIGRAVSRLIHVIIDPISIPYNPLFQYREQKRQSSVPLPTETEMLARMARKSYRPPSRTCHFELVDDRVHIAKYLRTPKYAFFYDGWRAGLPILVVEGHAVKVLRLLLTYVGVLRDQSLIWKIIRIAKRNVEEKAWISILCFHLLPALSASDSNAALSQELWSLLSLYPYESRYAIYGSWQEVMKTRPELGVFAVGADKDIRWIMNRLSKDTIKRFGRHIGKIVHSNPIICFSYITKQLESYDNMIIHVVDASRYWTPLESDIFLWCIMIALSDARKERLEGNGTIIAPWLKSLCSLTGLLCKRQHMAIELQPLLQFILNQLVVDSVVDVCILSELVTCMSGLVPVEGASPAQMESLSGGPILLRDALMYESASLFKKSSLRLMNTLLTPATGSSSTLGRNILLFLASQAMRFPFVEDEDGIPMSKELKIVGWQKDMLFQALLHFLDFVNLFPDKMDSSLVLSWRELLVEEGLDAPLAFTIARPTLSRAQRKLLVLGIVSTPPSRSVTPVISKQSDVGGEVEDPGASVDAMDITISKPNSPVVDEALVESVSTLIPCSWSGIKPRLYATFWQLALPDIAISTRYAGAIAKYEQMVAAIPETGLDVKKRRERDRLATTLHSLRAEYRYQTALVTVTLDGLTRENDSWFAPLPAPGRVLTKTSCSELLQHCIYPRCVLSPADALYSYSFIMLLHSLNTSFSTISLIQIIFSAAHIQSMVLKCTQMEAAHYGLFLCSLMGKLCTWHGSKELYEKEAIHAGNVGFLKRWTLVPVLNSATSGSDENESSDVPLASSHVHRPILFKHEEFKMGLLKWQNEMRRSFLGLLKTGDYISIRNSILILDKCSDIYPATADNGNAISACVQELEQSESSRGDLKQLARSFYAKLQLTKGRWVSSASYAPLAALTIATKSHVGTLSAIASPGLSALQPNMPSPVIAQTPPVPAVAEIEVVSQIAQVVESVLAKGESTLSTTISIEKDSQISELRKSVIASREAAVKQRQVLASSPPSALPLQQSASQRGYTADELRRNIQEKIGGTDVRDRSSDKPSSPLDRHVPPPTSSNADGDDRSAKVPRLEARHANGRDYPEPDVSTSRREYVDRHQDNMRPSTSATSPYQRGVKEDRVNTPSSSGGRGDETNFDRRDRFDRDEGRSRGYDRTRDNRPGHASFDARDSLRERRGVEGNYTRDRESRLSVVSDSRDGKEHRPDVRPSPDVAPQPITFEEGHKPAKPVPARLSVVSRLPARASVGGRSLSSIFAAPSTTTGSTSKSERDIRPSGFPVSSTRSNENATAKDRSSPLPTVETSKSIAIETKESSSLSKPLSAKESMPAVLPDANISSLRPETSSPARRSIDRRKSGDRRDDNNGRRDDANGRRDDRRDRFDRRDEPHRDERRDREGGNRYRGDRRGESDHRSSSGRRSAGDHRDHRDRDESDGRKRTYDDAHAASGTKRVKINRR